jgi:hypothetical protein
MFAVDQRVVVVELLCCRNLVKLLSTLICWTTRGVVYLPAHTVRAFTNWSLIALSRGGRVKSRLPLDHCPRNIKESPLTEKAKPARLPSGVPHVMIDMEGMMSTRGMKGISRAGAAFCTSVNHPPDYHVFPYQQQQQQHRNHHHQHYYHHHCPSLSSST